MKLFYTLFLACSVLLAALNCKQNGNTPAQPQKPSLPTRASAVRVTIGWDYQNLPLRMEIYEPATQQQLYFWQTGVVKPPQKPPVSLYIENGEFWQRPGSAKIFVLTMKNDTTKPVHFFAAPHHVTPPEYSLGFHFNCLCVNHVFTVNPGETWYRVVRLLLHKEHRGDKLTIRHVLIAAGDEQMKAFSDNPTLHKHIEANEKKHTEQGEN